MAAKIPGGGRGFSLKWCNIYPFPNLSSEAGMFDLRPIQCQHTGRGTAPQQRAYRQHADDLHQTLQFVAPAQDLCRPHTKDNFFVPDDQIPRISATLNRARPQSGARIPSQPYVRRELSSFRVYRRLFGTAYTLGPAANEPEPRQLGPVMKGKQHTQNDQ